MGATILFEYADRAELPDRRRALFRGKLAFDPANFHSRPACWSTSAHSISQASRPSRCDRTGVLLPPGACRGPATATLDGGPGGSAFRVSGQSDRGSGAVGEGLATTADLIVASASGFRATWAVRQQQLLNLAIIAGRSSPSRDFEGLGPWTFERPSADISPTNQLLRRIIRASAVLCRAGTYLYTFQSGAWFALDGVISQRSAPA